MANISRTCIVLLLVLVLVGCQSSATETQNLEKFYDYVSFYDFLYGSGEAGNFRQLITHFYNTFYPDNEVNVNVSVFQLRGVEGRVQKELESFGKAIEKEPHYEGLDERSRRVHDDLSQVFTNMQRLSELVSADESNDQEKEALFQETDTLIVGLSRDLGLWLTDLKEVQAQYELTRLQSFEDTSDQLSFMLLDTIMRSESVMMDMRTLLREGETDTQRIGDNITTLKEYQTPALNYAKDAKQLISSGLSSEEVLLFLDHLENFTSSSEAVLSSGGIDDASYNHLENIFKSLLELYNKA